MADFDPALLESDEAKAAIQKIVDEAKAGLEKKNSELIDREKKAKARAEEAEGRLSEISDRLEALESEQHAKDGDVAAAVKKAEDKAARELAKRDETIATLSNQVQRAVVDRAIAEAMDAANIAPQHRKAVSALYRSENKIEVGDIDGQTAAMVNGEKLSDSFAAWSGTEEGKAYVAAPQSSGSGGPAATGNGSRPFPASKPTSEWTQAEKSSFIANEGLEAWQSRVAADAPKP